MTARDRVAILLGLRIGGAILLAVGLYALLGGAVEGGAGVGAVLAVLGASGAVLVPAILVRRWRTPR
ncbi:hypothetical protein [Sphingomonas sp.]|uniref:hypothetical protein n=1 Tax=Sphingomonas sp. TaxID=28214 RepID=UPI003AFFD694